MDYHGNDFYCDVALKDTAPIKIVSETSNVLAFHHTNPSWPLHIVVVPKKHIPSLLALSKGDNEILLEMIDIIKVLAARVVQEYGGARILSNVGVYQDSKHLHFHICYGEQIQKG